jgi:excisionase family DNA binding protein
MTQDAGDQLYTVAELALRFRVSKMSIYRLIQSGRLESVRIGRSVRVPAAAIEELMRGGEG